MAQPNQPTPERAAQGAGKSIPIEDDRPADAKAQPQARPADASGSKETPSSDAAAAEAAPQGEAIEAEVIEDAGPSADEQVAQAKAEAQDWQDKYLRLHAEWDTYRRRTTEQREVEKARATEKLVTSLLPVIDDFERTIDYATKNGEGGLFDGVKAVHAKLVDVLKKDGVEVLVGAKEVREGDEVVVHMGNVIPFDGVVTDGEAMVNQSSMTGESMPIVKREGSFVYAGTVCEEGECVFRVEKTMGGGRYDRIVQMIEQSEKLKSTAEDKTSRLADKLVPYTLGGTVLTYLLTRNVTKMLAVLMVDFSCALKLAMPIAVLSAMREASASHISVKGGRFLEAVANANTVVFDKTGTLTYAMPKVADIVTFADYKEADMLRLAACLEEHYPHSMANAVVEAAKERGLSHEEYHSQVQYIVAHGISSMVNDKTVLIGSAHFVFEDEGCHVPEGEEEKFRSLPAEYSHLYLCIAGKLAAVICIFDPLRKEAADAVRALHACGIDKVVMMTGDNRKTAEAVAAQVGVDEVYAEVLPEDKAAFIRAEKAAGRTVIMIGDGVNDSPALSEADAGIAISTGAAIAREIADITIASEDLFELVTLRKLSTELMARIRRNYRFIVSFNFSLIVLGVAGILPPTTSALLHNTSTLAISIKSMTNLLPEKSQAHESV